MKQLLLLATLALLSLESIAQRWNLQHQHSIDLIAGVDYNFRLLSTNNDDEATWRKIVRRSRSEKGPMSVRLGFNYNYYLSDRLFLKSGLRLTNPGYKTTLLPDLVEEEEISKAHPTFFEDYRQINKQQFYMEIPLMVRYVYSDLWCKSYVEGGISTNIYLGSSLKSIKRDGSTEKVKMVEDLTRYNIAANFAIGGEFLVRDIPFFVQLVTRVQLTSTMADLLKERLVGMGIESGMRYEF